MPYSRDVYDIDSNIKNIEDADDFTKKQPIIFDWLSKNFKFKIVSWSWGQGSWTIYKVWCGNRNVSGNIYLFNQDLSVCCEIMRQSNKVWLIWDISFFSNDVFDIFEWFFPCIMPSEAISTFWYNFFFSHTVNQLISVCN